MKKTKNLNFSFKELKSLVDLVQLFSKLFL